MLGSDRNGVDRVRDGAALVDSVEVEARPPTSVLLRQLIEAHTAPRLSVGDLVHALGGRGFSLLFLALALPNTLPVPGPPGVSTVCGIPLAVIAWQMARGLPEPRLPHWLRRRSIATADFKFFLDKTLPTVARIERMLRSDADRRFTARAERIIGAVVFGLAVILALPIPLGNFLAALTIVALSLGHLESAVRALWVGAFIGFLTVAWLAVLAFAGIAIIDFLIDWLL
jgi:hypothetical protein